VHDAIREMAEALQYQPLTANMEIVLLLSAQNDWVVASPHQLRQVFLNMAINAADAIYENPEAGRLEIKTTSSGNILEIRFADNGPGIPEQHMEDIFDPFFTTKEPGKGTGLGLSVSFRIIESTGGTMEVISEKGNGTVFVIRLPAHGSETRRTETDCKDHPES